jgi:polyhydroxyalkanoate synthesis regulator phasin
VQQTFVVAPGAAADTIVEDNLVTIIEATKKQLQWCELARDHMRNAHQTASKQNAKLQAILQKLGVAARRWAAWQDEQIAALEYDYARADAAVEEWQDRHVQYVQFVMETLRNENF